MATPVDESSEQQTGTGEGVKPTLAGIPVSVLRWGFIIFTAASVAGFLVAFLISEDWETELLALQRFNPLWFVPAAGLMLLDWLGAGLRLKALIGPHEERLSLFRCTQVGVAGTAMAYLTPSGAGGGPANIYGLARSGLSLGRSAAVNAVSFLSNVIFLSLAGLIAWAAGFGGEMADIRLPVGNLSALSLFKWTAWGFAGAVGIIVVLALLPNLARGLIRRVLGPEHPRIERVLHHFDELHEGLVVYWRSGKLLFVAAILSGIVHFGSRFVLGWVVLKGFTPQAPFVEVAMLHIMIQYLLFMMPTPGGAGVGEVIAAVVMSPFLSPGLLIPYTAVWRVFLTYGSVAAGGGLMLAWLGADGAR